MSAETIPCPSCRAVNTRLNKFCDSCGEPLSPETPAPAPPLTSPPVMPSVGTSALPQAGRSGQSFEDDAAEAPRAKPRGKPVPVRHPLLPSGIAYFVRSVIAILGMIAMISISGWLLVYSRHLRGPQFLGPRLAARYLDALASGDYATAYNMLSDASKSICTLDEFRLARDTTTWTWSNLQIGGVEPGAVVLQYDLNVAGRPPIRDTITFVRENKRWVRPYDWPALKKAEAAFDANSPDLAMIAAQEAMHLDPRDPMARGYICEAAYYLRLHERVEADCLTAIELARRYPSKLSDKSLYHLHAILGDTYKNSLKNYGAAVEQYTTMLAFPNISAADQCELRLARAEAQALNGRTPAALEDLSAARGVCTRREDLEHIARRSAQLSTR